MRFYSIFIIDLNQKANEVEYLGIFEKHHKYDPLRRVLNSLHELLTIKNEIRQDNVFCPEWNMTITPRIEQCKEKIAVVGFFISDDEFDETLYECCASTGKDTDTAIGSCVGSFLFAFMNGIALMKNDEYGKPLESSFCGKTHRWKAYNSDLVGMGENVDSDQNAVATKYWDMIKDEIVKRLGNQRMCYVKIFASKAIGKTDSQVTGEVRINDVPIAELSEMISKHAETWNVSQFASQKQFFFIKQDSAVPDTYSGKEGRALLRERVKTALELYAEVDSNESYEALPDKLVKALGDFTLAQECYAFMPEMCAEHAFSEATFSPQIMIAIGGGEPQAFYRSQLAHYYPINLAMLSLFSSGAFGDKTNDIYRLLVGVSSSGSAISKFLNDGGKLKDVRMTSLCCNVPNGFEVL